MEKNKEKLEKLNKNGKSNKKRKVCMFFYSEIIKTTIKKLAK